MLCLMNGGGGAVRDVRVMNICVYVVSGGGGGGGGRRGCVMLCLGTLNDTMQRRGRGDLGTASGLEIQTLCDISD